MFKQTFCYHKVWHFVLSQGVFSMEKTPWKSSFTEKKLKMHFFFKKVFVERNAKMIP